jgi:hypothetical protein
MTNVSTSLTHELGDQKWKMQSGKTIRWRDMTDRHIANVVAMLRRRSEDLHSGYWAALCSVRGEAAMDAIESEQESVSERIYQMRAYADLMEQYCEERE